MISTEEDDADKDYNDGDNVRRPGKGHLQERQHCLAPLDHGSHTPLQPSPCAVSHTALTSSFPTSDESPTPLLPSPGHDATQPPAVVRHSATPQHAHNAVVCSRNDEAVAAATSACTERSIDTKSVSCHTASCDQTTLHPRADLLIKNSDNDRCRNFNSSTSGCLNSKPVLIGSNCSSNSDLTSALACQIYSADDLNNTTHRTQSSSLPCHDHFECSPRHSPLAADVSFPHSESLVSGCSTNSFSHHHRCVSRCPSTTPRSVSPSVARKPPQCQDHAAGISDPESTDRPVGRTVFNTSSDGRKVNINNNIDPIWQLSSIPSLDNVAAIPPLEQPLPPPSPPPPPDDTVPLLSLDLTASCPCYSPQHTLCATSQQPQLSHQQLVANNAQEREVANRCVNLQQTKRHSSNPEPVFNSISYNSENPLSRTLRRSLIGSSKFHEMHHNGDVCFGGQEKPRAMDLDCDSKTVFSESFSYGSNTSSLLPKCAPSTATIFSCKRDNCSHEPFEQHFKVWNSVSETECYASSGSPALNCSVRHGQTSLDLLSEPSSRNTCGNYACSAVDDIKKVSGSELLSCKNSSETPPSKHHNSPIDDFDDPVLFLQNCRDPDSVLPSNSVCNETTCCPSKELLTCQRNSLVSSTDYGVDGLYESFQPVTLQTRCSNSAAALAPVVSSFSSCISHQHTSPSPLLQVVYGSPVCLDAKSPVNSTAPNSLHRQTRITTRETLHPSTPTQDFNCTCSSKCCKANEVDEPASPCFDLNHDIPQSVVIVSNTRHSDSTVLASLSTLNPDTPVFISEASTASGFPPHPQESVRTTEGPPTSTTVGEDDQVILPLVAGADGESSECKMDSDSLLATTGLVLMHSQSSQDSGIASVPLEECYPPPLPAALTTKTLTSMPLDSCSEDLMGSLECDVFPCNLDTPSPCANTLENIISPSDDGAFVCEPPNSVHDGLRQPRHVSSSKCAIEHPSASPPGTKFRSPLDVECRLGERPSSISSSQPCSVSRSNDESSDDAVSQVNIERQPALILSTLCPSNAWSNNEQPQHTQETDQVFPVPTLTHQQHSLRRSTEVALDETFEAFDSVITAHRSALKVLVPECIASVGDVSILCLSDTKKILFERGKSKANTSPIFVEDRTFYPSKETASSTGIQTGVCERTNISLHCRASPCTGASLVYVVASDGVTSNGDTGCSIIRQDNNGEILRTGTGEASSFGRDEAPSLSVAPMAVLETTLYKKFNEPSITGTGRVGEPANSRIKDTIFLTKLDQFASHLAKELVQESVLLSSTHAWNIRCSGQCRREQCRQDYYQSLLLLNASLENDPVAAAHDYYSPSSAGVKKGIYGSSGTKATSIYSSSSSSTYGRNSISSVGSGGWLNHGGGDQRDSMHGGSSAVSSNDRTSAMMLALSSGGSPGLCWTPELPYASESGGKTVGDEEYLSPRDSDNGSGGVSSESKKLFGGGERCIVVESMLSKCSPYQFQKTISTNTTSANLILPFGIVEDISTEPERRIESRGLAESISNELQHVINTRSPTDIISSTLCCSSPSLPTSLPPSLPASFPPSRSSLSPPPSLSSTRPSGRHSRSSLSVSHDSLVCKTITAYKASQDDTHLITAAFSHDVLHYGGHDEVAAPALLLARNETCRPKQAQDAINSDSQHLPAATEDLPSSRLPSNGKVKEREGVLSFKDCDSNSDMFCPRADPTSCPVGKVSGSDGQKKKRRTKSRKRSSSNRPQQCFSKSSSHASNQLTTITASNEGKFYRKSRKHKTIDPSEVYSVPIDSIEEPGLAHPKAVIATQPRRHSHRKHRVTSSTITAGLPLINSSNIITNSNADVVSNSFGVGANGVSDVCLSNSADLRVVIRGQASSKESKKKKFSSNKPSRAALTSSVELSSPSSRQSIVSNVGCGNNNKSSVFSSPKQKPKHSDGKQSVASDPVYIAADDLQKAGHVSSDHEVHSDTVHQTYSNTSRVSRKERHEHHSRICRILPFTALKSCKRKDHSSESRDDVYVAASAQSRTTGKNSTGDQRKRGHSLFSNIRNSLLSLFSFGGSGGCDRSLSKEHKLRLKSSFGGVEGLRSSTSIDSDSQAVISTSGSEVSAGGCKGPTPAGPSAAIKSNDVTAVDLLNHSNYSAFTSAINVTSPRSAVIGAAGADAPEEGRDRGYTGGLMLSPEEQNCHGDDTLNKETLQRSNNSESVIAALLVPPPLPPANDPTTNSNNPLHAAPSVSNSSVVTTASAPLIASSALGCRSPVPVITNRALPPLPSAQPGSSVSDKTTNIVMNSSVGNASAICSASSTPPPIPPPLPQSLLSAVGLPLPPPLPATLRHSVAASIAAKASAARAGESRTTMGRSSIAANSEAPVLHAEKAGVFLIHGTAASVQDSLVVGERKEEEGCHFATMIEKVKDYGWYWGPISGKAAEKIISNEPDGSFIVRDSSDDHYIFSLTFKLNGFTRHVRIEHDQGNFSFGGYTKFKSQTIVEFIESAVEHSRSGRYLFFLHRRPVLGPMRVQLLHPVSRHRHIQSLQHLCRFVIVKNVRRDLLQQLPLPVRLRDYLTSPHYYSEQVDQCMAEEEEEQERVLQEAALATGAAGHEDNIQGQEIGTSEEAALDVNSIQGQDNVPPLVNTLKIEPNGAPVEPVNDLVSNREGQESVSLTDPVQRFMEACNAAHVKESLLSGVTPREGSLSDVKAGSFLEADSFLEDNSLLLGATSNNKDMNFRPVLQEKIQDSIGSKSLKRRSWDGNDESTGGNYTPSCSDSVRSGSCAVESPTLECHAVLEALNCLDESITQAEASIVAKAVCPSDEHSSLSYPQPSNSCILSDNKCISAETNPTCNSQIISRVGKDSCSNPLTAVHSDRSTCDSGATTRSLCSKSTTFPSSSAVPASGVSSKPSLSLSAYLHATPGKQIHTYKPGKIVSYQVNLASDSPTVIKLTKLVNQRISDEFRELNGSTTKGNSFPAREGELDEHGNTISTRDCKSNAHCTREEQSLGPLHSNYAAEVEENVDKHDLDHLLDCCSVGGAVIGLVDLETAFRNNKGDAITSNCSSEIKNTVSKSLIGHLSVFEDSGVEGAMVKSYGKDVNNHIHEEAERTDHADKNENSTDGGQAVSSSKGVVDSSLHARHPTLRQSFVNSASSLPSVILNASLEELGSF